jgi:hypothetical protein
MPLSYGYYGPRPWRGPRSDEWECDDCGAINQRDGTGQCWRCIERRAESCSNVDNMRNERIVRDEEEEV